MTLNTKRKVVAVIAIVVCVTLIVSGWLSDLKLWQKIVNDLCCTALGVGFILVGFPSVLSRFHKEEAVIEDNTEEDDSEIETDTEDEGDADYSDSCECDDCDVEVSEEE